MSAEDSDLDGVPLIENVEVSDHEAPQKSKKRKRNGLDGQPKAKKTKKPKDIEDDALDVESNVNLAIAHMDAALMADHIAQRTKRFRPDLSLVETEDISFPAKAILDTTSFNSTRTADNLADFLEAFVSSKAKDKTQKLSNAPNAMGSPHTLVVAAAGLRAADLTRALRRFQTKNSMVAKLFAKHIKLNEALESTKKTRMGIGVGTPQRLVDLLDNDSLKLDHLERVVVDASHIDQKKRGILDMKETQIPLISLLTRPELKERYSAEKRRIKLLFF